MSAFYFASVSPTPARLHRVVPLLRITAILTGTVHRIVRVLNK